MNGRLQSGRTLQIVVFTLIFVIGIFLRLPPQAFAERKLLHRLTILHPAPGFVQTGFDEGLYEQYVNGLIKSGITSYPDLVDDYIATQSKLSGAILPPVRFLYICSAYLWHLVFGGDAIFDLRDVSAVFSMLTLGLAAIFAGRMAGKIFALSVAALMAVAPTQLHMSQHALIDGFFAFWALLSLWCLWENLRAPHSWRWLLAYALALALLILTKENSFFVWVALVTLIVANRWLKFGTTTRELLLATIAGPLLGVVVLVFLAGGFGNLIETYRLLVTKASQTPYAIATGDGPYYRYLVDLLLVSPIILILSFGTLFRLTRAMIPELFFWIFIGASYLVMSNVKYGMNLRYANMWDMPLRFLACSQIVALASATTRYRGAIISAAISMLAAIELRQYLILAVNYPLYELITHDLLQALRILK
jgi:4-amino-4-deoxy-L-arabinose transferase-like glycosyltransferase